MVTLFIVNIIQCKILHVIESKIRLKSNATYYEILFIVNHKVRLFYKQLLLIIDNKIKIFYDNKIKIFHEQILSIIKY